MKSIAYEDLVGCIDVVYNDDMLVADPHFIQTELFAHIDLAKRLPWLLL